MNRLLFEKTGDAVYLSHLDLMRVFQRAFKRADIMIWHSQGFSPRAYVSIALPLPVGSESVCEILDFEIQDGSVDLAKLPALLNRTMPAGIRVLEAYESAVKIKHLTRLRAQITLEYDRGVPEQAERTITEPILSLIYRTIARSWAINKKENWCFVCKCLNKLIICA